MLVTITNASSDLLYVSLLYKELDAGESVTVSKSRSELDQETEFKKLVTAGTLTLTFATEDGDDAQLGTDTYPQYSNTTRPAATAWPVFGAIWNTNDNALNWSDGTNWRMADGTIT
jgi:hypothetical protein